MQLAQAARFGRRAPVLREALGWLSQVGSARGRERAAPGGFDGAGDAVLTSMDVYLVLMLAIKPPLPMRRGSHNAKNCIKLPFCRLGRWRKPVPPRRAGERAGTRRGAADHRQG
jgi:hypothetical protein